MRVRVPMGRGSKRGKYGEVAFVLLVLVAEGADLRAVANNRAALTG